jgi:signal transduction histidine kinase
MLSDAERTWLAEHPVLRLAPDPEFKPIEYFDATGYYQGIAAETLRLLEKKLGISITIVQKKNWDEVLAAFKAGDVDMLGAVVPTPARGTFMLFTDPLFDVPGGIFVRKAYEQPNLTLQDLHGKRVSVVSNYTAHDILRSTQPAIVLDVVSTTLAGLQKLSFGMSDAFVENVATAAYYLQESAITNIRLVGTTNFNYRWAIGIRRDLPMLQQILNKGLKGISQQERQQINNKWVPVVQPGWRVSPAAIAGMIAGLALFITAGVVIWNRSLSREITERKRVEAELESTNVTLEERVKREVEQNREKDRLIFQQARQAAMAEMLHSIAHQWRQPLNNIAIYIQNLELLHGDGSLTPQQLHDDVQTMMDIIMYMSNTIDDFRSFFRHDKIAHRFKVSDQINQALRYVSSRLEQAGITSELRVLSDPELDSYPSEYMQVLLNILNNAVDALVTVHPFKPLIRILVDTNAGKSQVSIQDNAGGIPAAILSHIFDPYFTTKPQGEGTGIGLYMAKVIVEKNLGGVLTVSNREDGAEFIVLI